MLGLLTGALQRAGHVLRLGRYDYRSTFRWYWRRLALSTDIALYSGTSRLFKRSRYNQGLSFFGQDISSSQITSIEAHTMHSKTILRLWLQFETSRPPRLSQNRSPDWGFRPQA